MSRPQRVRSQFKDLSIVPISGNKEPATRGVPPAFDGTITSACESVGISVEQMIEMMRWAKESDPRVAQFLGTWDALDLSERRVSGTADAICGRIGLPPGELLRIVAGVTCRIAMYQAQIIAAVSHPLVVGKTVERAMTDEGIADRIALHKATGFLPLPKSSQTIISIMQNAQANAAVNAPAVSYTSPEDTTRRLANAFNEAQRLPRTAAPALPERASRQTFLATVPENGEDDGE